MACMVWLRREDGVERLETYDGSVMGCMVWCGTLWSGDAPLLVGFATRKRSSAWGHAPYGLYGLPMV